MCQLPPDSHWAIRSHIAASSEVQPGCRELPPELPPELLPELLRAGLVAAFFFTRDAPWCRP